MASTESLSEAYFREIYAASDDPWHFDTSAYEAEKYRATIAMLGRSSYRRALEIGCSIGVLTDDLATCCERLVAVDIDERPLARARRRCVSRTNVSFARMTIPHDVPPGVFDLVVISEVGYYWSDLDLARVRDLIVTYGAGTTIELVHYLPRVDAYLRDGDAVHESFLGDVRFEGLRAKRTKLYRIDVLDVRPLSSPHVSGETHTRASARPPRPPSLAACHVGPQT